MTLQPTEPTRDHDQTMAWDKQQHEQEEARLASERIYDLDRIKAEESETTLRITKEYEVRLAQAEFNNRTIRIEVLGKMGMRYFLAGALVFLILIVGYKALIDDRITKELAIFIALIALMTKPAEEALRGYFGNDEEENTKEE